MNHIGTDDLAKLKHENIMYVYIMEHKVLICKKDSQDMWKCYSRYKRMSHKDSQSKTLKYLKSLMEFQPLPYAISLLIRLRIMAHVMNGSSYTLN